MHHAATKELWKTKLHFQNVRISLPSSLDSYWYFPLLKCGKENRSEPNPSINAEKAIQHSLCPLSQKKDTNNDNTQKAMS